jgi:hypothetical protein
MEPIFNIRYNVVNAIRFIRIGRFQFSFCLCGERSMAQAFPIKTWQMPPVLDLHAYRLATPYQYASMFR